MDHKINFLKCLVKFLKFFGFIFCILTFAFWSHKALTKYISAPISSHISYKNGDDNLGNITFPAISICLQSYNALANKENTDLIQHCSHKSFNFYHRLFAYCYKLSGNQNELLGSSNDQDSYYFPNWIEPTVKPEIIHYFNNISDVLNASKVEIQDFLFEYAFGDVIGVLHSAHTHESKLEQLQEDWLPTIG